MVGWKPLVALAGMVALAACAPRSPLAEPTAPRKPEGAAAESTRGLRPAPPLRPRFFNFVDSPGVQSIPDQPVAGEAGGQPFSVKFVAFQQTRGAWQLVLAEQAPAAPADAVTQGQYLTVDLPEEPRADWLQERSAAYGGGSWQLRDPQHAGRLMSWNGINGWALQLDRWELSDAGAKQSGVLGHADGWVAVCYPGTEELAQSYVAGRFTDAVIRAAAGGR